MAAYQVHSAKPERGCTVIRTILGDCREHLPVSADSCITDIPYAVNKRGEMLGHISANYHDAGTHMRGYADHDPIAYGELLVPAFDLIRQSLTKGANVATFVGNRTIGEVTSHALRAGLELMDVIVCLGKGSYAKSVTTLRPKHELIVWFRVRGGTRPVNPHRSISNVWDIPVKRSSVDHPTAKPLGWVTKAVNTFSAPGDIVLDPFAGSFTTAIAARILDRDSVMIEKDPDYFAEGLERIK